jgi:hypothetical protein
MGLGAGWGFAYREGNYAACFCVAGCLDELSFPRAEIVQVFTYWPENYDLVGWAKRSMPNNQ